MGKGHVKPNRGHPTVEMEFDGLPHENLAAAIVYQAVRDAQDLAVGKKPKVPQHAWIVSKWELINFFRSRWCATLLACTNLTGEEIIERTHLYELSD